MPSNDSGPVAATSCGCPLKPEPIFQERVWGQVDLSCLYASRAASDRVGEVWLTSDQNRIQNGVWAGATLGELSHACGPMLLGREIGRWRPPGPPTFPLLVKFLFTADKLSVQVHPADSYARQQEGSPGKTEMWYVLRAEPDARLAIGFRENLPETLRSDRNALRVAVESGAIEEMLHWFHVQTGDSFFVPAGTVHAIGAGLILCEIQQNSDITYRLYDYHRPGADGRPRPLHAEKAFDVLEWRTCGGRTLPLDCGTEPGTRLFLAACPYFATERWVLNGPVKHDTHGRFEIWIGLEGQAEFEAAGQRVACQGGEAVILPADAPTVLIHPIAPGVFLRTFVPEMESDVIAPLRAQGFSEQQLRGVCFSPPFVLPDGRQ